MFAPAGPTPVDEAAYFVGQPAQEMGMSRKIQEETRLERLPDARYLVDFAATARVFGTVRVGPALAHIEVAQAFDGDSLLRHGFGQHMGIFVGRLRAALREARPVRKHGDTSENLHRETVSPVQATPPDAEVEQADYDEQQ